MVLRVTFRVLTGASGVGVMEVPFTVGGVCRRLRNGIRIQGWGGSQISFLLGHLTDFAMPLRLPSRDVK